MRTCVLNPVGLLEFAVWLDKTKRDAQKRLRARCRMPEGWE